MVGKPMGSELRVLLVEDDPNDAALIRRSLRGSGFVLDCCPTLGEALKRLAEGGVSVVLSDLHLPDSQGLETVRRLKEKARGVPLVALTGTTREEDGIEAVRAGAQDYLRKEEVLGPHLARTLVFACERQEVERFKEELVRMVGHELRSPASTAVSALESLRDGAAGPLPEGAAMYLDMAIHSLEHQLATLEDLAQAHRAGMGRLKVEPRDVDPAAALRGVADELASRAAAKGVALTADTAASSPVRADPERLRQVLTNLVDNALKFTEPGGAVTLSVKPHARAPFAEFTVRDTGPGLAPAEAANVFEKLYQAPLGRKAGGLGLGLYIAREFVQSQGGLIWVESELGAGTSFHFTLPYGRAFAGRPASTGAGPASG
ncbi:response regulator [bacterium]|nr:MAG: response regulator [bacterium]